MRMDTTQHTIKSQSEKKRKKKRIKRERERGTENRQDN